MLIIFTVWHRVRNRILWVIYLQSGLFTLDIVSEKQSFKREFQNKNFQCERGLRDRISVWNAVGRTSILNQWEFLVVVACVKLKVWTLVRDVPVQVRSVVAVESRRHVLGSAESLVDSAHSLVSSGHLSSRHGHFRSAARPFAALHRHRRHEVSPTN